MGWVLSLAMSSILGVLLLFLGCQLFDCWLRGYCPPPSLAHSGSGREHHWHADVWPVRERAVRDPGAGGGKRRASRLSAHLSKDKALIKTLGAQLFESNR